MSNPEQQRVEAYLRFHEDPLDVDLEKAAEVCRAINALATAFPDGGWLHNLVWNTRNSYMSDPERTFPAEDIQKVCEGFLAEIAVLRSQIPDQEDA